MSHLTRSITACSCGRPHHCPIRTVSIGEGALLSLPAVCAGYSHILLVADTNTYAACGERAEALLGELVASKHIFAGTDLVIPDEASVRDSCELMLCKRTESTNVLSRYFNFTAQRYNFLPIRGSYCPTIIILCRTFSSYGIV